MISVEKFTFTNAKGITLDGRLEKPLYTEARATALFAHCFTCTKQSKAATRIASALAAQGIAVLRFDFTGLGGSEGEFANAGFVTNVDDLVCAANALRDAGSPVSLLIGHSLGGAAVIAAAHRIEEARAVVTLGAPFHVDHVLGQLGEGLKKVREFGEAEVDISGRPFRVSREFLDQTGDQPLGRMLRDLDKALLVCHAPTDEYVALDNAGMIFDAARHPKSFFALDGADHLLTRPGSAEHAAAMVAAWFAPYVPPAKNGEPRALPGIVAVETAGGKFAQHVRTATHDFIADEPKAIGGNDDGPTPYDLLLASLGTCTSMTIKMYADRKKWPLEHVQVELEHSRDHKKDCEDCDADGIGIQTIDRAIHLTGDLNAEQRARLMEIADRCPVHRTLESELRVKTTQVS